MNIFIQEDVKEYIKKKNNLITLNMISAGVC